MKIDLFFAAVCFICTCNSAGSEGAERVLWFAFAVISLFCTFRPNSPPTAGA